MEPQHPPDAAEKAAVEQFCKDHFGLAQRIARKWARWFPPLDIDLESECMYALLTAARTRASWPGKPESLVHLRCHHACMRLVVRERRRPDAQINLTQPDGAPAVDRVSDDSPGADLYAELADLLNQLPARRRQVIVRRFLDGENPEAVGAMGDVTARTIQHMIRADFAKLRKLAGEE